jgi:O-antigen/teichoic acid export membrane protein
LGITDFGIYNVVGGVVAMFGFITNTMASASQRFLAFEIGRKDIEKLKRTFSVTLTIYLLFAIIVVILAETVGLWVIYYKLNIPTDRFIASVWVYQFSVLAFIATIIRIPYNAAIIAYERMGFFAWSSIIEVGFKLLIVFMLVWFKFDKLILYSILTFLVVLIISILYQIYCRLQFPMTKYQISWEKELFQSMFGFAGWNLFASLANVGMNQGVNILLNIFFGPAINATRGIAYQINGQILGFVGNFQIAASPQIIKYYAADQKEEMKRLYFQSSRLSYYLLFIIALPVLLEMDLLLHWWLKEVPEYTVLFARLIIITTLMDCMSGTTIPVVQATGKIKNYQLLVGTTILLNLPISYLFLKLGYPPEVTMIIAITLSFISLFIRLYIVRSLLGFKIREYLYKVVKNNILISIVSTAPSFYVAFYFDKSISTFLLVVFTCIAFVFIAIFYIGLSNTERIKLVKLIRKEH